VRIRAVGTVPLRHIVIQIIEDVRSPTGDLNQGERANGGRDCERGVQFAGRGFARVAVQPDDQKLARTDGCLRRKSPWRGIRVIVREIKTAKIDIARAAVVEFAPGMVMDETV